MSGFEIREVPGTHGRYHATSLGHVISVMPNGRTKEMKEYSSKGYRHIHMCVDNIAKDMAVHRLVASAFIGKCPDGFTVNHKNEKRWDNRPENLEYLSRGDNARYSLKGVANLRLSKPVIGVRISDGFEVRFISSAEAGRTLSILQSHICDCCRGMIKSYKGYRWRFA